MDPVRNPFVPGAGTPPPALVGREDILKRADVTLTRIRLGRPSKSFLLIGLRGVGKTVLLNRIQELAEEKGYKTVMIEATENKNLAALLIPPLRKILFSLDRMENVNEQVKRALRVFKSFAGAVRVKTGDIEVGLDVKPELGTADSGDLEADLPEVFVVVAQAAASRRTAVALIIDEVQYLGEKDLSALILAIHQVNQKQLPLVLIGAGLPQLVGLTGKSKSYAERLFDFPDVGPLEGADAMAALVEPVLREGVHFAPAALRGIIEVTKGYPYFLQEWGHHAWDVAQSSLISAEDVELAGKNAIRDLDASFFRVRFDRLTPREKSYLRAMAALGPGPHRSGDVAERLGSPVQTVAPLRSNLIKKGMIYSPSHGDTAFTVPLFDEFIRRIIPEL